MKILVPLDGSSQSEAILPLAVQLAERWQAEVLALRVTDSSLSESMVQDSQEYLRNLQTRYPDLPLRTLHEFGSPRSCIEAVAAKESCELILMASHGRAGFTRWLLGSVSEGVARHASCPTILVHSPEAATEFQHILIPTDGSQPSLEVARRIGRFLHPETRVTLLHCFTAHPREKSEYLEMARIRSELHRQVDGRPWLRLEFAESPAPQGIFDWLAERECDLIAMSTHGRDGLSHLLEGSVCEEVARHARCPVLIFPPATSRQNSDQEMSSTA